MALELLRAKGLAVAYGKPLGTCFSSEGAGIEDEDVRFAVETLENLSESQMPSTLLYLDGGTVHKRLRREDKTDYRQSLAQYLQTPSGESGVCRGGGG